MSSLKKIVYKIRYKLKRSLDARRHTSIVLFLVSIMCFVWLLLDGEDDKFLTITNTKRSIDLEQLKERYDKEVSLSNKDDNGIGAKLFSAVHITCVVMSHPKNFKDKVVAVKATWGRRCNRLLIFSSKEDKDVNPVVLNMTEDRSHLWGKTKEGFKYVYNHHLNETDWVLKADDDSYIVMENLRFLLSGYNKTDPAWFGFRFKLFSKSGYMSGGGGYVLSKEALTRFVEVGVGGRKLCKKDDTGAEDAEMGKCLHQLRIRAMETRDIFDREMFHPLSPENHINFQHKSAQWLNSYTFYPIRNGFNCCSDYTISFHYLPPPALYALEYFIYHLKTVGKQNVPFSYPFPLLPPQKKNVTSNANASKTNDKSEETKNKTKVSENKKIESENKAKEIKNKTRDFEIKNLDTRSRIKATKTEINELMTKIKESEKSVIDTTKEIEVLEKYIAEDKVKSDPNEKDLKTIEITESGNNIKDNKIKPKELETKNKNYNQNEIKKLETKIKDSGNNVIRNFESETQKWKTNITHSEKQIKGNETKMNGEISKMRQSENEINNNQIKTQKLDTKFIDFEKQMKLEDKEVELKMKEYENEINDNRNKTQELESKMKNSENKHKSDETKANEFETEMKQTETKIKNDHKKTHALPTKIKDSENINKGNETVENNELVTEIKESKNETEEIENKLKELEMKKDIDNRIKDIQNKIKESESNKREMEKELKWYEEKTKNITDVHAKRT